MSGINFFSGLKQIGRGNLEAWIADVEGKIPQQIIDYVDEFATYLLFKDGIPSYTRSEENTDYNAALDYHFYFIKNGYNSPVLPDGQDGYIWVLSERPTELIYDPTVNVMQLAMLTGIDNFYYRNGKREDIMAGLVPWVDFNEQVRGEKGDKGDKGDDGNSAYDLWLLEGNVGSYEAYRAYIKGEKGDTGNKGDNGTDVFNVTLVSPAMGTIEVANYTDHLRYYVYNNEIEVQHLQLNVLPEADDIGVSVVIRNRGTFPVKLIEGTGVVIEGGGSFIQPNGMASATYMSVGIWDVVGGTT